MKVILLQDVPKIGYKYEVKDVTAGHATNFLFPQKLAELATDKKIKSIAKKQAALESERKIQQDLLAKNLDSLKGVQVEIQVKANEKGHLFEGIHTEEIIKALKEQKHIDLDEDMIVLEQPIKEVGEFSIEVKVGDSSQSFTLVISKIK